MVILEGADGSGKDTLLAYLVAEFGFKVGERAVADRKLLYTVTRQDTYTALAEAVLGHNHPKIWNRLYFSELVYAPVIMRTCEFRPAERSKITGVMEALGVPVIVCHPPLETVHANVLSNAEDQMSGVVQRIPEIWDTYDIDPLGWPTNTVWYDYTGTEGAGQPPRLHPETLEPLEPHDWVDKAGVCEVIQNYIDSRGVREW